MDQEPTEFWCEFENALTTDSTSPLDQLDLAFRSAIQLITLHLNSTLSDDNPLDQALHQLLHSDLFRHHSQRMTGLLISLLQNLNTPPSIILIACSLLLRNGSETPTYFRSLRNFSFPIADGLPIQSDGSTVSRNPTPSTYNSSSNVMLTLLSISKRMAFIPCSISEPDTLVRQWKQSSLVDFGNEPDVPESGKVNEKQAERRLGPVLAGLLYELCRVQKLDQNILDAFDESLIGNLFELVELTRDQEDETFNYNLIKLIIALNEQFMVASLHQPSTSPKQAHARTSASSASEKTRTKRLSSAQESDTNIVIRTMKQRLDESKTFGENLIFILNRASHAAPEGLCVSLLILKILYLLFTTFGTHEYFYTNDLCVLVDVFIRELGDLPNESEGLRHTYLRVLYPLLTSTQLRSHHYKRREIRHVLLSHVKYAHLHEVNPTTKRLVERNLKAEWCIELEKSNDPIHELAPASRYNNHLLRSGSTDTLASQASGSVSSVTDVTVSSAPKASLAIHPKTTKLEHQMDSPDSISPHIRVSIPTIISAQAQVSKSGSTTISVSVEADTISTLMGFPRGEFYTSSPRPGSIITEPPDSEQTTHSTTLESRDPNLDSANSSPIDSPQGRPPSTVQPFLSHTRSFSPYSDYQQRPTSASSTSSLPRRPAPKPPTNKRSNKEPLSRAPRLELLDPSDPTNPSSNRSLPLNPARRSQSSPVSPKTDPHKDTQPLPPRSKECLNATSGDRSRRAAPSPPVPPSTEAITRRRKAPQPPTSQALLRPPAAPSVRVPLHDPRNQMLLTPSRTLRGSKSHANLSRNNSETDRSHPTSGHHRVTSLTSSKEILSPSHPDDYDPFADRE